MPMLVENICFALRILRKHPGFATVAMLTFALGIGATTAIFSVVYATMLSPLPYPNPDQLVLLWSSTRGHDNNVSVQDYLDWKAQSKSFQNIIPWRSDRFNVATAERPEQVRGLRTGAGWYTMLGWKFSKGRDFLPEETEPGKDLEVILPYATWVRRGSDPNIIGKTVRIDQQPHTVVGVLAPGAPDRMQIEFLVPFSFLPEAINRQDHPLVLSARLKPGVSMAAAESDLRVIAARIASQYPATNQNWGVHVTPLRNYWFPKGTQNTLWALLGAVGFLLLIACANVANLLLAKASTRRKEVAVRASLGATRLQIFLQFLTESIILSLAGGVLGILLAQAMLQVLTRTLVSGMGLSLPSEADIRLSLPVLLFTLGVSLLAGVLFGCSPAWQVSALNVNETLRENERTGTDGRRQWLRRILIVSEFALALTLLSGAGMAMRSFWNLSRVDLGIRTAHILTFGLQVSPKRFATPQLNTAFYQQILDRLHALPGVTSANVSTGIPMGRDAFGTPFDIVGQPHHDSNSRIFAVLNMATPEYFKTFGVQLLQGRTFTDADRDGSSRVAVVNQFFVAHYLPGVDPIGQRLLLNQMIPGVRKPGPQQEWVIVGVTRDVHTFGAREQVYPEIDVPFDQSPWPQVDVAIRTSGDPDALRRSAGAVINSIDADLPMSNLKTMDQLVNETFLEDRSISGLLAVFAVAALVLAAIGIYGVMSFSVAQRTHEIGLRMALGADRPQVLRLILREGLILALVGLAIGLIGGVLVGLAGRGMLYGVARLDYATLCAVAALLFAAAMLACFLPARKATKVDPMVALRCN
jgi:putative ABC transport system permease protein